YCHLCVLLSFPTRRSSDLGIEGTLLLPIASQAALEPSKTAQIAQILSARADSASQEALGALLEQWSLSDTERALAWAEAKSASRSEEHTSELQSREKIVCR